MRLADADGFLDPAEGLEGMVVVVLAIGIAVLLGVVILQTVQMRALSRRFRKIQKRIEQTRTDTTVHLPVELHAMSSLQQRFPGCTVPTSPHSMRFANLHAILTLMDELVPARIVELGSGISTFVLASWMRERGKGKVFSFDHDPPWAETTRRFLASNGLAEFASITCVDLKLASFGNQEKLWYDVGGRIADLGQVEMLVVDGPPAGRGSLDPTARYCALPFFAEALAPTCAVVLDDAGRSGEKTVISEWLAAYPEYSCRILPGLTGLAILRRNAGAG